MSFSKNDLEKIKSKISISSELEKRTKLIKKGKDNWCCCPFHEEKTPSCKVNEDQNSFYCFGCGAKGDIFTLYTDLYNFTFIDAVKELSQRAGVVINLQDKNYSKHENKIEDILKLSCEWYQENLDNDKESICFKYLKKRKLTYDTIRKFKLGYSFNSKTTLYQYLKQKNYNDDELLKSNVVKLDKKNNIRDYFYKRLIFPITNVSGRVVGFGGRSLDNTEPKYINSPESNFFQKRYLLYNLDLAKNSARKKNNILICEGYMDVISLYQHGILSVVAPLGTAMTENQLMLAWKYSSKPTIMFDGDTAGIRASYKSAIMALALISPKKFLQFILLPDGLDPDNFINKFKVEEFVDILKKPVTLINFIFSQSSKAISLENADEKISYDKYLDDLVETIKDQKTKYFYKNEFKSLFFDKIRNNRLSNKEQPNSYKKISTSLNQKQILSFILSALNHEHYRDKIIIELLNSHLLDINQRNFLEIIKKDEFINEKVSKINDKLQESAQKSLINSCLDKKIIQLFPYSSTKFDSHLAFEEVSKSINNLNTRLLNLKKINKSLNSFIDNLTELKWEELQEINKELLKDE